MKLLLVDDDAIERAMLRDILRAQANWTIHEAEDGRSAFELLSGNLNPSVCIFDVRMPHVGGLELLTKVRQAPSLRHLKVIMTSSARDRELILGIAKQGISGYLLKPYEFQKTTASLTQILGTAQVTTPSMAAKDLLHKTVLVVDDDALTRESLATLINGEEGWEAVTADDGLAALELLRSGLRPDLAVFDLRMPRLDGRALLTRVREDPNLRRMPVVIASGQQDRELIRSLAQLRISGYLLKPIDLAKARATLLQAAGVTVSA